MTQPRFRVVFREDAHTVPAGASIRDGLNRWFISRGAGIFETRYGAPCPSADLEFPITIERRSP